MSTESNEKMVQIRARELEVGGYFSFNGEDWLQVTKIEYGDIDGEPGVRVFWDRSIWNSGSCETSGETLFGADEMVEV